MSERRTDRSIDQTLEGWMGDVAPDRPPTRLLEETFARTMTTRQARTYPWHTVGLRGLGVPGVGSGSRIGAFAVVALVVAALVVGLVAGGPSLFPSPSPSASPTQGATPAASPSPKPTPRPTAAPLPASITVTPEAIITVQDPMALVVAGSTIWSLGAGELDRIDPDTDTVTASVPLGGASDLYNDLAISEDGLWVTDWTLATLYRVDPAAAEVVARIPAGLAPKGILAAADGVWVADTHDGKVLRIDPATNTVVARITVGPVGNSGPNWLARGLGSIWVNIPNNRTIVRIDPVTNAIQAIIPVPGSFVPCGGFVFEAAVVATTECGGFNEVAIIDPVTNTVLRTEERVGLGALSTPINGGKWVSLDSGRAEGGMLARINASSNAFDRVLVTGSPFGGGGYLVVLDGSVWVADGYNDAVLRLPLAAFGP